RRSSSRRSSARSSRTGRWPASPAPTASPARSTASRCRRRCRPRWPPASTGSPQPTRPPSSRRRSSAGTSPNRSCGWRPPARRATHFAEAGDALEAARWNERAGNFAIRSDIGEAMRRWRAALDHLGSGAASEEAVGLGITCRARLIRYLVRRGGAGDEAARLYGEARSLAGHLRDPGPLAGLSFAYGTALTMDG